uniref:Uncharacterized protein n=1 Tax=Arundo donax TaxID=35708 RepID=A0A0A9FBE6_ARUDO
MVMLLMLGDSRICILARGRWRQRRARMLLLLLRPRRTRRASGAAGGPRGRAQRRGHQSAAPWGGGGAVRIRHWRAEGPRNPGSKRSIRSRPRASSHLASA